MTKQEALKFLETLPDDLDISVTTSEHYVSCSEVERLGVSRQLLGYHVKLGSIKTKQVGRYKKYLLNDILKIIG